MKTLIFSLAAVTALAAATPSLANHQRYGADRYHDAGWMRSVEARADALTAAVEDARYAGHIDSSLALSIIGKLRATVSTAYNYQSGGVTQNEVRAIDKRFRLQEQRLRTGRYHINRYNGRYRYGW